MLSTRVFSISTNGPGPRAHQSVLVTGFYTTRYIVGMFIMGVLKPITHYLVFVMSFN
jgi:chromate transport protein ChrA